MIENPPVLRNRVNKYMSVAKELAARIESGQTTAQLPSVLELATEFEVTNVTIQKALRVLKSEGLVRSVRGQGTFVTRLKRKRTNTIGVVLGDTTAPMGSQLVAGLQSGAHECEQALALRSYRTDEEQQLADVRTLVLDQRVDGLVLWLYGERNTDSVIAFLREEDVPFVLVPEPDLVRHADCRTVSNAESGAAADVMTHLIGQGRRAIAFASDKAPHLADYAGHRWNQYRHSLSVAGLPSADVVKTSASADPVQLAKSLSKFDAVFCVTDRVACTVLRACLTAGIRVPGDLAVAGYDNSPIAADMHLTSVEQHFEQIGETALNLLLDELDGKTTKPAHLSVASELVIRGSTTG
jgi:DNA-binding LacI/PurR family transcriptional regulator